MKNILLTLLILGLSSCSKLNVKEYNASDCGITIESPYTADNLIFGPTEVLSLAIRFIQFKELAAEKSISEIETKAAIDTLNSVFSTLNVQFIDMGITIDTFNTDISMSDYRSHILNYKRNHANDLPAIDVFIYPVDFEFYPAIALGIKSDAIAIQKIHLNTNTLIHEVGHCLGLKHTHQPGGNGYEEGDQICDTPATGVISSFVDGNCNYGRKPQDLTDEEMKIIIHNYMSYVNRGCRKEFTKDQKDKMRFNIAKEPLLRNTLIF